MHGGCIVKWSNVWFDMNSIMLNTDRPLVGWVFHNHTVSAVCRKSDLSEYPGVNHHAAL